MLDEIPGDFPVGPVIKTLDFLRRRQICWPFDYWLDPQKSEKTFTEATWYGVLCYGNPSKAILPLPLEMKASIAKKASFSYLGSQGKESGKEFSYSSTESSQIPNAS